MTTIEVRRIDVEEELWALMATEACHPLIGLFGSKKDALEAAQGVIVDDFAVLPCILRGGEVVLANSFDVTTHAGLKRVLGEV